MKKILFVDDQWCKEKSQCILRAEYGSLTRNGFEFVYETAFDGYRYTVDIVLEKIEAEKPIHLAVVDMNFTAEYEDHPLYDEGMQLGRQILRGIRAHYPEIPVVMHSSSSDKDLVSQCLALGAKEWLEKKAPLSVLEDVISKYAE